MMENRMIRFARKLKFRGVSLVEVLISLLIMSIVMGIVAQLSHLFGSVSSFSSQNDQGMQVELAMWQVGCEAQCGTVRVSPVDGSLAVAPQLSFTRVDPSQNPEPATPTSRLPLPIPSPVPTSWNGFNPPATVSVLYYLDTSSGNLMRQVTPPGTAQAVAPLQAFSCQNLADNQLQLNYTYTSGDTMVVRSQQVFLPLR
jgi:prepilin-type N-terminal cleavage/methylation domain-containing protein